jgi:CheY-like chemotaxis protein
VSLESTPGVGSEFKVVLNFGLASPEALSGQEAPAAADQHPLLGVRVLVVDDSDINLDVTKRILELEGAQVWLASNGQEAFERLAAEPHAFDVVLMDVQMPVLDGHDATQRIRSELGLLDLPIIALTAGALSSERERAAEAGMDHFIIKPFGAEALVRYILRYVKPARGRPAPLTPAVPEPLVRASAPWPEIDGIDSIDARARLGEDLHLFRSMLGRLLEEFCNVPVPALTEDPAALAAHGGRMHKLKGCAGMLGAKGIQALAASAEAACSAGDVKRAGELTASLAVQLQRLIQSVAPSQEAAPPQPDAPVPTHVGELDPQLLGDLVDLLRHQDLAAVDRFAVITPQLQRLLGEESYALVEGHMKDLKFADALEMLEANKP